MGPTWVLSAPSGPHVGPMNLAIRVSFGEISNLTYDGCWKRHYFLLFFSSFFSRIRKYCPEYVSHSVPDSSKLKRTSSKHARGFILLYFVFGDDTKFAVFACIVFCAYNGLLFLRALGRLRSGSELTHCPMWVLNAILKTQFSILIYLLVTSDILNITP